MKTLFVCMAFTILISVSSYAQLDKGYWIGNLDGGLSTD